MKLVIKRIREKVEPIYCQSAVYAHTIRSHALGVAEFARDFAGKIGANAFVAEVAGLLHDVGAAKFGPKNHHATGAMEATPILLECGCPLDLIGPIVSAVYRHRGSQDIPLITLEDECVAGADAVDHFVYVDELWLVHERDLKQLPIEIFPAVSGKLERDWEKTTPRIRQLLDGQYQEARKRIVELASGNGRKAKERRSLQW